VDEKKCTFAGAKNEQKKRKLYTASTNVGCAQMLFKSFLKKEMVLSTTFALAQIIVVYLNLFLYLCSRFTSKVWNKAD
jgi:uncharacterized membrane protein YvbJ